MNEGQDALKLYVQMIQMALNIMQSDHDVAKEAVEKGYVSEIINSARAVLERLCDSIDADIEAGRITDPALLKQYQELREKIKAQ